MMLMAGSADCLFEGADFHVLRAEHVWLNINGGKSVYSFVEVMTKHVAAVV